MLSSSGASCGSRGDRCCKKYQNFKSKANRDAHPSEAMMHFPLFQIPPISEKFFRSDLFPKKIFDLHPPKFLTTFFKFLISPLFSLFHYTSLLLRKNVIFPLLLQISPDFVKFTRFLHTLCF